MNHYCKVGLAACCALATLTVALAQGQRAPTPEQRADRAIDVRQSVMTVQAFSIGPAGAMARGNMPFSADVAQKAALRLTATSGMIADTFKLDTSKFNLKTRAKPDIWTDSAGFDMQVQGFVQAVAAFQTAAAGGDKDATIKAIQDVGKSCGSCHDKYREKEKD